MITTIGFGVTIINQKTKVGFITDINGQFEIVAKQKDVIRFSYIGKKTKYYTITLKDTLFLMIKLEDDYTNLKEFVVNGKKIKKVSVKENDNILDYYSLGQNTFLVLKSNNRGYQIAIEGVDAIYKTYPIDEIKPKEFFLDVFGNFHLICKDSVRQFYFDSSLYFIESLSFKKFNTFIKSLLYQNDSVLISYAFSNHNKKYNLISTKKNISSLIAEIYDKKAEKVAKEIENEIIRIYFSMVHPSDNIILNKTWDGKLVSLLNNSKGGKSIENSRRVFDLVSWYD